MLEEVKTYGVDVEVPDRLTRAHVVALLPDDFAERIPVPCARTSIPNRESKVGPREENEDTVDIP